MKSLVLTWQDGAYSLLDPYADVSPELSILFIFLYAELQSTKPVDMIEYLKNPEYEGGGGNAATYFKLDDGKVAVTLDIFTDYDPMPEFATTIDNLVDIITRWDVIQKKQYPNIAMIVDGENVTFEPLSEWCV